MNVFNLCCQIVAKMVEKFTEKQISEYKEAFALFDYKVEGKILLKDIGLVIRTIGFNPTLKEIDEIIANNTKEKGTKIDFLKFLRIMAARRPVNDTEEDIRAAFRLFDKDLTGYINVEVLRNILVNMAETLSEDEVNAFISEADTNQDGQIDYEAFVDKMISK